MIFTSESVTKGHPDKICDRVSDTLLDEALRQDPKSKVALDTWVKDNNVGVIGEITTNADLDYEALVRQAIAEIGYTDPELGFDSESAEVHLHVGAQSPEINTAVVKSDDEVGAGDQGIMFGFASNDTEELMPLPIMLAHKLSRQLEDYRETQAANGVYTLRPDGKTQVSANFDEKLRPQDIDTILISTQHSPDISQEDLRELLIEEIIKPVLEESNVSDLAADMKILTNPSGSFVVGGPVADSGLTGRKIVVDGYGGKGRVGGGAFSGKDPSKVDRSAAYMARFLAKQIVAKGWAEEAEVQLSYAIGQAEPVSVHVTGILNRSPREIEQWIIDNFDLRPVKIIQALDLERPIYVPTSSGGHFGRVAEDGLFPWEALM